METGDYITKQSHDTATMADVQTENEQQFINTSPMKNTLTENYIQHQQQRLLKPLNEMHESNNTNISTTFQNYVTKENYKKCSYDFEAPNQNNNNNEQENFVKEVDDLSTTAIDSESQSMDDNLSETNNSLEPSHHARRPMNAFLIFCKRHRAVVREKYPTLENRAVTKILGEWWAGLEEEDKASYTALAKQYKDAFFNANPGFKWYKLPAPPLRTLHTRPCNYTRPNSSMGYDYIYDNHSDLGMSDFTPGKLADETQLGNLSSLIDPNYNSISNEHIEEKPIKRGLEEYFAQNGGQLLTPDVTNQEEVFPPKPPRKRYVCDTPKTVDSSAVSRNIFDDKKSLAPTSPFVNLRNHALSSTQTLEERKLKRLHKVKSSRHSYDKKTSGSHKFLNGVHNSESMTQQELIDRIVEHSMRTDDLRMPKTEVTKFNHTRKSGRSCKGKRYAEFMTEGRLVVNKRNKKNKMVFSSKPYIVKKSKQKSPDILEHTFSYNVNLDCTIQKLSDRTKNVTTDDTNNEPLRQRTHSGASDDSITKKMFRAADFNLDEKIEALPSLSLEKFQQKKKESKKRKKISHISKSHHKDPINNNVEDTSEANNNNVGSLTGSRKRKARKESITHVVPTSPASTAPDLSNLATLAEVAVKLGGSPP